MSKAAGILFLSAKGTALFLRRSADIPAPTPANFEPADFQGYWDFPGGGREDGETAEECAQREATEEIGFVPDGARFFHTRTKGSALKGVAGLGAPAVSLPVSVDAPAAASPVVAADPPTLVPDVDFTTFIQRVDEEFTPVLNAEHDAFAWAPPTGAPGPLHPGCQIALDRLVMNELGVARAIADGRLTSPQRYENIYLFAIRITGTDVAYRPAADEFAVRDPKWYLNEEFLARCNGLPVIFRHPKTKLLTSEEFSKRVVGTTFLPYIAGDEVWAVVKIWVDDVARLMAEGDLSTSPGVNFADWSVNRNITLELEDGTKGKVLLEGDPSLIDHVAICGLGVWDKGEEPSGIRSESREDSAMGDEDKSKDDAARKDAEEKERQDKARKDAEDKERDDKARKDADDKAKDDAARKDAAAGITADKMLSHIMDGLKAVADSVTGLGKRMDSFEKEREDSRKDASKKDGEDADRAVADKSKKDAEDERSKEDARKDAARKDKERDDARADSADVLRRIEEVRGMIPKDMNDADYMALLDAQSRADEVFQDFGQRAPRPQQGETVALYERRCVKALKEHSPTWKAADVSTAFADDAAFGIVRDQVYREARHAAKNPVNVPVGALRMVERKQDGHTVRDFYGEPKAWMDPLAGSVQLRGTGTFMHQNLGRQ